MSVTSPSLPEVISVADKVWEKAQGKTDCHSWYSILLLLLQCPFLFSGYIRNDKPERLLLLKYVLIEKYLKLNHNMEIIEKFNEPIIKDTPSIIDRKFFFMNSMRCINEARKLRLKIRFEDKWDVPNYQEVKLVILGVLSKLLLMKFISERNGRKECTVMHNLIGKKIKEGEEDLSRALFTIPLILSKKLASDPLTSAAAISLQYPPLDDEFLASPEKIGRSLWFYSICLNDRNCLAKHLFRTHYSVMESFVSISNHMEAIGNMIELTHLHHQDFMVNVLSTMYQLFSIELYLEHFLIQDKESEKKVCYLLNQCQCLIQDLETSAYERAHSIHHRSLHLCKFTTKIRVSFGKTNNLYQIEINIYKVNENPKLKAEKTCFLKKINDNLLTCDVFISNNCLYIDEFLNHCNHLSEKLWAKDLSIDEFRSLLFKAEYKA